MGYEEVPHTADWALRVWAPDLSALLCEAAAGMNELAGIELAATPRQTHAIDLSAPDAEVLLVAFLSEMLYLAEQDGLAFDRLDLAITPPDNAAGDAPYILHGVLHGAPIAAMVKAIKAVTFHNLRIERTVNGLESVVVFDV